MSSHLNVCWEDEVLPENPEEARSTAEAYQAALDSIPAVKDGGAPAFVYFDTKRKVPKKGSGNRRTMIDSKEALDCKEAWADMFHKEGDYTVFLPGRFFNVFRIDVTDVSVEANKYVNTFSAPLLLLARKDGTLASAYEGKTEIKRGMVCKDMESILKNDDYLSAFGDLRRLQSLMTDLEKATVEILLVQERIDELGAKLRESQAKDAAAARRKKAPVQVSATTRSVEKQIRSLAPAMFDKKAAEYEILKAEYALLQKIGLDEAKMPKEPVPPAQLTGES